MMTIDEMSKELDAEKDTLARHQRDRDSLIQQYGTGVRPSWVSTDLAIADERIQRSKNRIIEIEETISGRMDDADR